MRFVLSSHSKKPITAVCHLWRMAAKSYVALVGVLNALMVSGYSWN